MVGLELTDEIYLNHVPITAHSIIYARVPDYTNQIKAGTAGGRETADRSIKLSTIVTDEPFIRLLSAVRVANKFVRPDIRITEWF